MSINFNAFLWKNFLESKDGQQKHNFFSTLKDRFFSFDEELIKFIETWKSKGRSDYVISSESQVEEVVKLIKNTEQLMRSGALPSTLNSEQDAIDFFKKIGTLLDPNDSEEDLYHTDDIPNLSIALYCLFPRYFFPYFFYPNFYSLKKIFNDFGIFLPTVPKKSDYEGRFYYYLELCQSLWSFWKTIKRNPLEICTFLYGFCPEVIGLETEELPVIPKPKKAWLIGGGVENGDINYLDSTTSGSRTVWTGNCETEPGDILVMYVLTPRSEIHSIWRATSFGQIEPFRHYYSTVWMAHPLRTPSITLNEMKSDSVLSNFGLIRGNFQGVNGKHLPKKYYDRIVELISAKSSSLSLPMLECETLEFTKLECERDVEIKILEPLLKQLGFDENSWKRQVSLRVGRSDKVIPDYVILPKSLNDTRSIRASWIWEAKFSIKTNAQLKKDFEQASSYARLVNANGVSLLSQDGIWIGTRKSNFDLDEARHWPISKLSDIDAMNEIRSIAGLKALLRQ